MLSFIVFSCFVILVVGQAGPCTQTNDCVWGCKSDGTCASPIGKRVCFKLSTIRCRSDPTTASTATVLFKWSPEQQSVVVSGPTTSDGFSWFELQSGQGNCFSAFSKESNGDRWFFTCPDEPAYVDPVTTQPAVVATTSVATNAGAATQSQGVATTQPDAVPQTTQPPVVSTTAVATNTCGAHDGKDCKTCLNQPGCKWCPNTKTCTATEAAACLSQRLALSTCDVVCYPNTDGCCAPNQTIKPAGEPCGVNGGECVLDTNTCDGIGPGCDAKFKPNDTPCNQGKGACKSGVCRNKFPCSIAALDVFRQCETNCKDKGGAKHVCGCAADNTPTSDCWNNDRINAFAEGTGDSALQKTPCPTWCNCVCVKEDATGPSSASSCALSSAALVFAAAAAGLHQ